MWLTLALGCADPDVNAFLDARASVICERHAACDSLEAAGYADVSDCLVALEAAERALADEGSLQCPMFDEEAAALCLSGYTAAPCDTAPDLSNCDEVCR